MAQTTGPPTYNGDGCSGQQVEQKARENCAGDESNCFLFSRSPRFLQGGRDPRPPRERLFCTLTEHKAAMSAPHMFLDERRANVIGAHTSSLRPIASRT